MEAELAGMPISFLANWQNKGLSGVSYSTLKNQTFIVTDSFVNDWGKILSSHINFIKSGTSSPTKDSIYFINV